MSEHTPEPKDYSMEALRFRALEGQAERLGEIATLRSQIREQQEEILTLRREAREDPLTGLLRDTAWKNEVQARINTGQATGIFMLDLDAFKKVNDKFGHAFGNTLLIGFSNHLNEKFRRDSDIIGHENLRGSAAKARAGIIGRSSTAGDEFLLAVDLASNDKRGKDMTPAQKLEAEHNYLYEVINEYVASQPQDVQDTGFNASIGSALFDPEHPLDLSTLLAQADEAMYEEKNHFGRGR